jgi:predicted nucleic acid-binding protein
MEAGALAGYPVVVPPWVTVHDLAGTIVPLAQHVLDSGEAAVIQLAIERGISDVCIDSSSSILQDGAIEFCAVAPKVPAQQAPGT